MSTTKTEFAVNMTCKKCARAVEESLSSPHIQIVDIDVDKKSVVVESSLSTTELLHKLESTGRKAVLRGVGESSAGVAILEAGDPEIKGVVRFVQLHNSCVVDGTIDGLSPTNYNLSIHENGDISQGCESCGEIFDPLRSKMKSDYREYGDLGEIKADSNGRASFRFENKAVELPQIIGRSLLISQNNGNKRLACGIIARSAGLFQNPKTICSCSGVSIWDETKDPKQKL